MGYRSQVVIGFKQKDFNEHVGEAVEDFKDCSKILQDKENVIFIWDDVKWYPDYEDVKSVMKVFDSVLASDDDSSNAGFLRVGEDNGDIEQKGSPYDFEIYSYTTINVDDDSLDEVTADEFFKANSIKFIKEEG